jgi:hypothetical protein
VVIERWVSGEGLTAYASSKRWASRLFFNKREKVCLRGIATGNR